MRGFFASVSEAPRRVLLIESAPREAADLALSRLYSSPQTQLVDVLSCYAEPPKSFDPACGSAYFVYSSEAVSNRWDFIRKLSSGPYDTIAMVSTGSAVLRNWKWAIAFQTRARLLLIDEAGELIPFTIRDAGSLWRIILYRSNVASAATLVLRAMRLLNMPFVILYLCLFTLFVHARRWLRLLQSPRKAEASS